MRVYRVGRLCNICIKNTYTHRYTQKNIYIETHTRRNILMEDISMEEYNCGETCSQKDKLTGGYTLRGHTHGEVRTHKRIYSRRDILLERTITRRNIRTERT